MLTWIDSCICLDDILDGHTPHARNCKLSSHPTYNALQKRSKLQIATKMADCLKEAIGCTVCTSHMMEIMDSSLRKGKKNTWVSVWSNLQGATLLVKLMP